MIISLCKDIIDQSNGAHMQDITEFDYWFTHNEVGSVTCDGGIANEWIGYFENG